MKAIDFDELSSKSLEGNFFDSVLIFGPKRLEGKNKKYKKQGIKKQIKFFQESIFYSLEIFRKNNSEIEGVTIITKNTYKNVNT
ncbi:MAG: hypothetical protein LR001_01030 [Clostridiales bacterium]|nr:hypothetical protein [Clostridiales bacterium]